MELGDQQFYSLHNPIPWYYGVAYCKVDWMTRICYPVPINFIVRWAWLLRYRWDTLRIVSPRWVPADQIADRLKSECEIGIEIGQTRGYNEGYKAGYAEYQAKVDALIATYGNTEGED